MKKKDKVMISVESGMIDVSNANNVDVTWNTTARGPTLWINIDGVCRMRVYGMKELRIQGKKIKGN